MKASLSFEMASAIALLVGLFVSNVIAPNNQRRNYATPRTFFSDNAQLNTHAFSASNG
jgi:hypothetical protein